MRGFREGSTPLALSLIVSLTARAEIVSKKKMVRVEARHLMS